MSIKLADAVVYLAAENSKLKQQLDESEKDTKSWTNRIADGIAIGIGNAVVNAVGKGVQAVGNLGRSVVSFSTDSARAVGLFQAQLGASADEAQALTRISQEVWKNNYGSNVLEAADNVALVRRQLNQLGAEGIRDVTQVGFALRDTFGTDMPKYIDAVRSLMDNFGVSHQQAMNIITAGYQRGLDRSGDFLESITEYAPQFATAKASADQFFSAMETGLQGGVLGTDRALDMFKEFRVRLLDGSETTATGLRQIGLSMDDITTRVNNGSLTWADAFTLIQDKLRSTDNQALQMQAGVALLGTQFEDLGTQAALAVDLTATSLEELDGAASTLGARYQNIGDLAQGMGRRLIAALSPAASVITNMANQAMPMLDVAFQRLEANATVFAGGVVGIIKGIWTAFQTFFTALRGGSDKEFSQTANNAGEWGKNIVLQLARGMAAAAIAVVRVLNKIGEIIAHWLQPHSPPLIAPNIDKWGQATMQIWLDSFGSANLDVLRTMGSRVMDFLSNLKDGAAVQMVGTITNAISGLFQGTAAEDDTGLIGRILGSKEVIARAIAEIQDFGGVGADTLAMLEQALGSLPPVALDYVQAMLQLQQANQAVTAAQEELNRVTKEYDDRLKPINDELAAIQRQQQDEADAKRMAELQKAIARGQLTDEQKRQALAQLRELELRKQQRALEAERDTAVDAAQEQLDAAEEQQKAAQQQAELQAALIEQQREANDLVQQQISLLDRLANVMAGVGDALGNALSGASLGDTLGNIGNIGDLGIGDELDNELNNILDGIDIEGLVTEITNEFKPLGEEMGNLGTTFKTVRTNLDGFLQRLGILNEDGSVATDTIQAIKDGVVVLGTAFVTAKIATWVGGIITAIAGLSSGAGIFGAIGAAVTALGGPFVVLAAIVAGFIAAWKTDFLGMRTTLTKVAAIITYYLSQLGLWFRDVIPKALNAMGHWFSTIWEGIKTVVSDGWEWIGEKVEDIVGFFTVVIPGALGDLVEGFRTKFADAKTSITIFFTQTIPGALQAMVDGFSNKFEEAKTAVQLKLEEIRESILERLRSLFADMGLNYDDMVARWSAIWEDVKLIASTIWERIKTAVTDKILEVSGNLLETLAGIQTYWSEKWEAVKTKVSEVWESIKTAVAEAVLTVYTAITDKIEELRTAWETKWTEIQDKLAEIWETMKTAVTEKVSIIYTAITGKIEELRTAWATKWTLIKDKLSEIWTTMKTAVTGKVEEVYTTVTGKVEEILTWFTEKVSSFRDAGASLMSGMIDGVTSKVGELIDAATGAVEDAIEAAKRLLGIASPSKVFHGFGVNMLQGMANGISDMSDTLRKSLEESLTQTIDVAANAGGIPGAQPASAVSPAAAPVTIQIDQITLGDKGSVDRFFEYLSALSGQRDLVRFGSIAS